MFQFYKIETKKKRVAISILKYYHKQKKMTTPEAEFAYCFERMYELCRVNGWGDPFSYARSREIHLANKLGHTVAATLSGADAIDEDGECEYKTTVNSVIQATYNGISKQPTWEEQEEYLINEKIGKYKYHYYSRFEGSKIVEMWMLTGKDVLELVLPRLKESYKSVKFKKDPRLGITLSQKWIKLKGKKLI